MSLATMFGRKTSQRLGSLTAVLLIGLWSSSLAASDRQNNVLRLQSIPLESGLSQAFVTCATQDQHGFMWFGTQEGLNRYDGYEFEVFAHDHDDPSSLPHDSVKSLLVDHQGQVWVGTDGGGLSLFDPGRRTFSHFQNDPSDPTSLSHNRIRALLLDDLGFFWVGTDGGGLNLFDSETGVFERFVHDPENPSSLSHNAVRSIVRDQAGTLWIATEGGGLDRFEPKTKTFTHFRHNPEDATSLSDDNVRVIFEDTSRNLWVGTYENGLARMDRGLGTFTSFRSRAGEAGSLPSNSIRTIFQDQRGTLWIGTDEGLVEWCPENDGFKVYQHDPLDPFSLNHNAVLSMFQDQGGILWIGTFRGLNKWNTTKASFSHIKSSPDDNGGLSNNYVTSFSEDADGAVWIGTHGGGLNRMDLATGDFQYFRHNPSDPQSLSDDRVMSQLRDSHGTLWVGTISGGLNRLRSDDAGFDRFQHESNDPESLSSNAVTSIFESSAGELWVGTYRGGLNRMDRESGTFERFRHQPSDPKSLANDRVLAFLEDRQGTLWIGTDGGGFSRFEPETGSFVSYRNDPQNPHGLTSNHIWSLNEDSDGNLWLGSQGHGLYRWSQENREQGIAHFDRFAKRQGLPSAIVNGALWDDAGTLWVSTNGGLSRFDPVTESFTNYDLSDGLQSEEFNFAAAAQTNRGEMYFGGINGFNSFFPAEIQGNTHVPPVVLTAVLKLNQPLDTNVPLTDLDEVTLRHQDRVVDFEFSALDFAAPEKNCYSYKLEGFDESWVDSGSRRRATYTNLDPGDYRFLVRASNSDGVWNEKGLSIGVRALPPPWKTVWAYLLYSLALGLAIALFLRAQARRLRWSKELARTNEALKEQIAERQSKERALDQEKERAHTYFEVLETIMVALSSQGTVAAINHKGCRVLGYSDKEIIGKDWFESFVAEDERSEARRLMLNCEDNGYSEHSVITHNNSRRTVAWHSSRLPLDENSDATVISSGTDITKIRRLEKQLYLSQKMDAIGTLAGGIAHDFNNILQSILGYTIISLEALPPDSEINDYLKRVVKAGERAKKLIGHILTFSHRGKQEHGPIRVQEVMQEALELLRPSLPANIEIESRLQDDCLPVLADPTQIHQVIMNLCTNAYQAMDGNAGKLTVSLELVEITAAQRQREPMLTAGQNAVLRVSDTGQGMDPSILDKIFDPFFTTRKVGSGTGLGLSVVHGIVKGIGGKILVSSEVGIGTEFEVYLPCSTESPRDTAATEEAAMAGRGRILVVDDEQDIAEMLGVMLQRLGYEVTVLTSATEALEILETPPVCFDLLITDQTMPGVSGTELAYAAKASSPEISVIVVSGFLSTTATADCVDFSMQKPFVIRELGELVQKAFEDRPPQTRFDAQ